MSRSHSPLDNYPGIKHEVEHVNSIWPNKTFYEVIGLTTTANEDEIKKTYRKLVMSWHPDKQSNADDTKFKGLNTIYHLLIDLNKRVFYDSYLKNTVRRQQYIPSQSPAAAQEPEQAASREDIEKQREAKRAEANQRSHAFVEKVKNFLDPTITTTATRYIYFNMNLTHTSFDKLIEQLPQLLYSNRSNLNKFVSVGHALHLFKSLDDVTPYILRDFYIHCTKVIVKFSDYSPDKSPQAIKNSIMWIKMMEPFDMEWNPDRHFFINENKNPNLGLYTRDNIELIEMICTHLTKACQQYLDTHPNNYLNRSNHNAATQLKLEAKNLQEELKTALIADSFSQFSLTYYTSIIKIIEALEQVRKSGFFKSALTKEIESLKILDNITKSLTYVLHTSVKTNSSTDVQQLQAQLFELINKKPKDVLMILDKQMKM